MAVVFKAPTDNPAENAHQVIQLLNKEFPVTYVQSVFKGEPVILNRNTQSVVFRFIEDRIIFGGRSSDIVCKTVQEGLSV